MENLPEQTKLECEHQIGEHGAVFMIGKKEDICVECGQEVKKDINPLRVRVYERLIKMNLKDLADKVNELVDYLND